MTKGIELYLESASEGSINYLNENVKFGIKEVSFFNESLKSINNVKVGDKVLREQQLGTMGKTGRATSEHLHFEKFPYFLA